MDNAAAIIENEPLDQLTGQFKKRVAHHFGRAATTYDHAACFQRRSALLAMRHLPDNIMPEAILDLGSGTGYQTLILKQKYPNAVVTGLDISKGMLNYAHASDAESNSFWVLGDIEQLPFKKQTLDVVFSSMAIQWCNLEKVLQEVKRVLKPGGRFVYSSLAKGTFWELRTAWSLVDGGSHTNSFPSTADQKQLVKASGLTCHTMNTQIDTQLYPDVRHLLQSLKSLGVNAVVSPGRGLMTKGKLKLLARYYEVFRQPKGLPLSYRTVVGHLIKPVGN